MRSGKQFVLSHSSIATGDINGRGPANDSHDCPRNQHFRMRVYAAQRLPETRRLRRDGRIRLCRRPHLRGPGRPHLTIRTSLKLAESMSHMRAWRSVSPSGEPGRPVLPPGRRQAIGTAHRPLMWEARSALRAEVDCRACVRLGLGRRRRELVHAVQIGTHRVCGGVELHHHQGVVRLLSVLTTLLIVGCGSSGVTHYIPSRPVPVAPRAFEDELMTYAAPAKPFAIVGQFQTAGYDAPDLSLTRMREYAAGLGLDGVAMIRCNLGRLSLPKALGRSRVPDTMVDSTKKGDCAGQGFVWMSR